MKEEIEYILKNLNTHQKNAVQVQENSVIAAGAGSGKTKVLVSRFIYFIVEKGIDIENILALTFTDKAASEMNKRIYNDLKKLKDKNAQIAVENFHKAKISTLDSFCNSIARLSSKQFGISPDFRIDNDESYKIAKQISFDFFLKYRANKIMQFFLADNSIENFVENLFVRFLTRFVFISKSINLKNGLAKQIEQMKIFEKKYFKLSLNILNDLKNSDDDGNFTTSIQELIENFDIKYEFPHSILDKYFFKFLKLLQNILSNRKRAKSYNATDLKTKLNEAYQGLLNVYNFEYSKENLNVFFDLLDEIQKEFITKKKQAGVLTFADVSHLAVDALTSDIDLRNFYKKNIDLIMIDEFQDNNSLQRDLLFLVAENLNRKELTVPQPDELLSDKLFFVGDEKQSIYGFRGADVSVFRSLAYKITTEEKMDETRLSVNYRTEPELIDLFNLIFSKVFYSRYNPPENKILPNYEAEYLPTRTGEKTKEVNAKIEILLFDKNRLSHIEDKNEYLSAPDQEAYALAKKIKELYNKKKLVKKDNSAEPCKWSDFAILLRTSTNQGVYERIFRLMQIPYKSVQQKGLFTDAPLNDIYSVLKLLAYPSDKKNYAQVLRSPFVNIDDDAFAVLILNFDRPFDIQLTEKLNKENKLAYTDACEFFLSLKEKSIQLNSAELVSYLWYEKGYRYFLLTDSDNLRYVELYDYFFELARQADLKGFSLAQFVDSLYGYIEDGEKLEDMEIPLEQAKDAVSFLTVHKSKGLEFPIVCVPDCGNRGFAIRKEGLVFYNNEFTAVVHSPQVPNLPIQKNMIFENLREEANNKLIAEIKRLLYVAATRAESYLIMSSAEKHLQDDEELDEYFFNKPRTLEKIKSLIKFSENQRSFFDLLLPTLPERNNDIIFTEILPQKKSVLFNLKNAKTKINFSDIYKNATVKEFPLAQKTTIPATALGNKDFTVKQTEKKLISNSRLKNEIDFFMPDLKDNAENQEQSIKEEFTAVQLGSIAHGAIEAKFLNKEFYCPSKIANKIKSWVDNFFNSDIYKLAKTAKKLKTEYAFLTKYQNQIVSGQIDLVFSTDEAIHIIDYKTDEIETPENHKIQLAVYKKAIADLAEIRGDTKIIKTYLFYLKTGNCIEI